MLLLRTVLRALVSNRNRSNNVRPVGRGGRGRLACRRCSRTAHGAVSRSSGAGRSSQLTYAGHFDGVDGARGAAEAGVVVLRCCGGWAR